MNIYLILSLITVPLAVWRLSNMLSDTEQEGLFNSLDWIRSKVGVKTDEWSDVYGKSGSIASLVLCIWCSSVWFGIFFAVMLFCSTKLTFFVSLPFALSAVAIFIEEWRTHGD